MGAPEIIASRTQFLTRYFDPGLDTIKTSIKELESAQLLRLDRALVVVIHAGSIPRRLGGEATDQDLAIDRKRARRMAWAIKQSKTGWSKRNGKMPEDPELRIEGAQLIWPEWYAAYTTTLASEATAAITWAVRNDEQRWGRSAVVKFDNELNWVSYAMRD